MNIGFLGTGLMGAPMARRLQTSGHQVYGWNRSAEKLAPLAADGITTVDQPEDAIAPADLIVLMTSHAHHHVECEAIERSEIRGASGPVVKSIVIEMCQVAR